MHDDRLMKPIRNAFVGLALVIAAIGNAAVPVEDRSAAQERRARRASASSRRAVTT